MFELAFDKESNPHRSSAVAGPPGSSTAPSGELAAEAR